MMTAKAIRMCSAALAAAMCVNLANAQVPVPFEVPGKEYITELNTTALGVPLTGQTVGWDGLGGAFDSFVFGTRELDGIAHMADGHFEGLLADENALILSLRTPGPASTDPMFGGLPASLFYQEGAVFGGDTGVWATAPMLNAAAPPIQISGIELWGPAGDTTHWSEFGDSGGSSIFTSAGTYLTASEIEFAIGATVGIDVDALMILDHFGGTDLFHVGDFALISIRANSEFDGGEIWLLERGAGGALSASFFDHGGVLWDTDNEVAALFGLPFGIEDIDALEVVIPAPATPAVLALLGLFATRRRRHCM